MNIRKVKIDDFERIYTLLPQLWPDAKLKKNKNETFIIVEGTLVRNFRDRKVEVHAGEMIVIPKGVEHKPYSGQGYKALLIEPEGVANTGNVQSQITIAKVEWV